jgi:hypothetical protein
MIKEKTAVLGVGTGAMLSMRFVCYILLYFGTSTKDPIQSLD